MKLKIYNETWDIKEVSQERLRELHEDKTEDFTYWGSCGTYTNEIFLLSDLGPQRKRAVLVHEVAHAIIGIELGKLGKYSEEELCNFIAQHYVEIGNVVKEYFKPKKKRIYKKKDPVVETITPEVPE